MSVIETYVLEVTLECFPHVCCPAAHMDKEVEIQITGTFRCSLMQLTVSTDLLPYHHSHWMTQISQYNWNSILNSTKITGAYENLGQEISLKFFAQYVVFAAWLHTNWAPAETKHKQSSAHNVYEVHSLELADDGW